MPRQKSTTSKATDALFFEKGYGAEPTPGMHKLDALNWYNYGCDDSKAKSFLLTYFKEINDEENYKKYKEIDSKTIYAYASTSCWYARMLSIGFDLNENDTEKFWRYLETARKRYYEQIDPPKVSRPSYNPMSSIVLNNAYQALNNILDSIDIYRPKIKNASLSIEGTMKKYSVHKFYKNEFITELKSLIDDLDLAINKTDEEVLESYRRVGYSPLMMKRKREHINNVLFYVEDYFNKLSSRKKITEEIVDGVPKPVVKAPRKPRKKKLASPDKRVSRLKYLKKHEPFGIVSVDPRKILGASEVWVFNIRYSQLQVYYAKSEGGFDFKGTTLLNFDETRSQSKRIGRKAEEIVNKVLTSGKVALRRVMDEINSMRNDCNGRFGEYTLILRVIS